ncbi:MAG: helix-turn-helix domain-containing protein [Planctomycetes bacterium]|nr:helix-turn-helix domain-containing protein [Planctomycetota bacterium]
MDADRENPQTLKPAALTVADVARLLGVPVEVVQKHLAEGAPHAADGSMNLVHYAAWLNKRLVTAEPEAKPDGD